MRLAAVVLGVLLIATAGCVSAPIDTTDTAGTGDVEDDPPALLVIEPIETQSAREPVSGLIMSPDAPQRWSFAVLSDLHLPNPRAATVDRTVEALIALGVRLVIVTGDHTNGSDKVDHRRGRVKAWRSEE